jgi:DUF4097 and DUF4098 domain-containing protein YvlB
MRRYVLPLVVLAVAGAVPALAVTIDRDYHESFDVREGVRLELRHGDGDVTITPWDKDVIEVEVRYFADVKKVGIGSDPDFAVEFDQSGDVVRVIGHEKLGSGIAFFQAVRRHDYRYTISAPSYVKLELNGDDGDVSITGWRADIECVGDDGDIDVSDVMNATTRISVDDGDVQADGVVGELTVSGDDGDVILSGCHVTTARISIQDGDVVASGCEGDFRVSVDDGDVSLDDLRSRSVKISGEDGDVEAALTGEGAVDVEVATDDGDITVSMSGDLSYAFVITMDDGDVRVDVPTVDEFDQGRHLVSGEVRGGEGRVHLSTSDGNVVLREDE